jgi:hypothetical protein
MANDDHSWLLLLIDGHWMGWDVELTLNGYVCRLLAI